MADVFGLVVSICDASEKIYNFYQAAQKRDNDISDLRLQLLGLQEKSILVRVALEREGLRAEDQHKVKQALERCDQEVKRLQDGLAKFPPKSAINGKALTKIKLWIKGTSQEAKWPFQRSTILDFLKDIRTCQSAVDDSIKLLHLGVSARTVEELRALDDKVLNNTITVEGVLRDLRSDIEAAFKQVSEQLAKQEQELLRQTEVITNRITDQELEKLLLDPDFQERQKEIVESDDRTYDFFTKSVQEFPQAADLLNFLQTATGIFWISGEAASGKSTLMKHLSSPRRQDDRHLWVWEGIGEITIARHFCWIAGSSDQKSHSALLRTLLYYILTEENQLVPIIFNHGIRKGHNYAAWRIADLWSCLYEAVAKSTRRICLFIDGLDELEETSGFGCTHEDLIASLIDLSRQPNLKIVVSSRPWTAFQALGTDGRRSLQMETVNRRAILDYWHLKLAHEKIFADATWSCLYKPQDDCHHQHEGGHRFVSKLIEKSNGNFLWTTLVAKSLSEWLKGGTSMTQLIKNLDNTPSKLTEYLRDRVLMRVNDAWAAQRPLALKMSVYTSSWVPFWMLRNCDLQQLSIAEPDVPMCLAEYTLQQIREMVRETIPFLQECCRDLLDLQALIRCVEMSDYDFADSWCEAEIKFIHRSIFDFLRTPDVETKDLVFSNLPESFHNEQFERSLNILSWAIRPAGSGNTLPIHIAKCWYSILKAIMESDGKRTVSQNLAVKAQDACLHQAKIICWDTVHEFESTIGHAAKVICYELASYGLYKLTDLVLEKDPGLLCLQNSSWSILRMVFRYLPHSLFTHFELLRKSLEAGADPNEHVLSGKRDGWTTTWCDLLVFLNDVASTASTSSEGTDASISSTTQTAFRYTMSDTSHATLFSQHIQTVLGLCLQYGAELELDTTGPKQDCDKLDCHVLHRRIKDARIEPLSVLRKWLPMDDRSEWPVLLESYMQPNRRKELRDRRRAINARLRHEEASITEY